MYKEFELQPSRVEGTGSGDGPNVSTIFPDGPIDSALEKRFRGRNPVGGKARIYLDVTAVSGTPTLDVDVIGIINGKRHVLASFTQTAIVGLEVITVEEAPDNLSTAWVVGGTTPSMTWNVQVTRS